jgi:predicted membrane channel-forming protein YqfA (hemolysin III family)
MERPAFLQQTYATLREEIKETKARLFWIVAMGLFGVPLILSMAVSDKLAEGTAKFVTLLIPYVVLVLIIMFLSEQNALMRAGRYIKDHIETHVQDITGWESWLGRHDDLRLMDKHLFACFTLVFFLYYFMTVGLALQTLMTGQSETDTYWRIGAGVTYIIGAIWALSTLMAHWRTCTTTVDKPK